MLDKIEKKNFLTFFNLIRFVEDFKPWMKIDFDLAEFFPALKIIMKFN